MEEYTGASPIINPASITRQQSQTKYDFVVDKNPFNGSKEVIVFERDGNYFAIDFCTPTRQVLFYQIDSDFDIQKIRHKQTTYRMFSEEMDFDELILDRSIIEGKNAFKTLNADTKLHSLIAILQVVAIECKKNGIDQAISKLSQSRTEQYKCRY